MKLREGRKMSFAVCYVITMAFIVLILVMERRENAKYSKGRRNRYYTKTGSSINYTFINYAYLVPYTKERALEILSHKNIQDKLVYQWNCETQEIIFYNPESYYYNNRHGGGLKCQLTFEEQEGSCILYVEQNGFCFYKNSNRVYLLMDAFWSVKMDAHPYENPNPHHGEDKNHIRE